MKNMYNPETQGWVEVPDEDVEQRYRDGFMFERGERVDVFFPESKRVITVDASKFDEALVGGGTLYTGSMRQADDREERLSGWEGKALAAKAGALGGALIDPVGDAILAQMGDYSPEDIAFAREEHPLWAMGAGVAGFGGTLAATGGLSAAWKAAGFTGTKLASLGMAKYLLPPVATTALAGKVTGALAAKGVSVGGRALIKPLETGLTGAAAKTVVSKTQLAKMAGAVGIGEAAAGAVEGGMYALGRTVAAPIINEEAIGSPDEIVDAIIHDSSLFSILGGSMGATFTVGRNVMAPAISTLSDRVKMPFGERWAGILDKITVAAHAVETPDEVLDFMKKTRDDPEWVERAIASEQNKRDAADTIAKVATGFNEAYHLAAKKHTGETKATAMFRKIRGLDPDTELGDGESLATVLADQLEESLDVMDGLRDAHIELYRETTRRIEHNPLLHQTRAALDEVFPEFMDRADASGIKFRYVLGDSGPQLEFSAEPTGRRARSWIPVDMADTPGQRVRPLSLFGLPENYVLPTGRRQREAKLNEMIDESIEASIDEGRLYEEFKRGDEYKAHMDNVLANSDEKKGLLDELNVWRKDTLEKAKRDLSFYGKDGKKIMKDEAILHKKIIAEVKKSKEKFPKKFFDSDSLTVRHFYRDGTKDPVIRLSTKHYGSYDFVKLGTDHDIIQREFYEAFEDLKKRRIILGATPADPAPWLKHEIIDFDRHNEVINLYRRGRGGREYAGHLYTGRGVGGKFTSIREMPPSLQGLKDMDAKERVLNLAGRDMDAAAERFVAGRKREAKAGPMRETLRARFTGNETIPADILAEQIIGRGVEAGVARKIIRSVLRHDSVKSAIDGQMALNARGAGLKDMGAWTYRHLDDLKKLVDKSGDFYKELPDSRTFSLGRYAGMRIGQTNNLIRQFLENDKLWGAAALAQKEVNGAFADASLLREDLTDSFTDFVAQRTAADPNKVREYIEELADNAWGRKTVSGEVGTPHETGHISTARMQKVVEATEKLTRAIQNHYSDPEFGRDVLEEIRKAEAILPRVVEDLNAGRALQELRGERIIPAVGMYGAMAMTGTTGALPFVLQVVAPAQVIQTRARLQSFLTKKAEAMAGGASKTANTIKSGKFSKGQKARRALSRSIRQSIVNAEIIAQEKERNEDKHASAPVKNARAMAGAISSIAADPERLTQVTNETTYPLDGAPKTQDAMGRKMMNAVTYLNTNHPPGMNKTLDLTTGEQKFLTTEVAANQYLDMVYAMSDPLTYLSESFEHGRLSSQAVKGIETIYPELMAEYRMTVREELAGLSVPPSMGAQLSLLLGSPATVMHDGQVLSILQGIYSAEELKDEKKSKRSLRIDPQNRMSATQRIAIG